MTGTKVGVGRLVTSRGGRYPGKEDVNVGLLSRRAVLGCLIRVTVNESPSFLVIFEM
jgi:hypothetical protein